MKKDEFSSADKLLSLSSGEEEKKNNEDFIKRFDACLLRLDNIINDMKATTSKYHKENEIARERGY